MSEHYRVSVQLTDGTVDTLFLEVTSNPPWKIAMSGTVLSDSEFEGPDLFDALVNLRLQLDGIGARLLCGGARIDAFPSGMARSMGSASKVYITKLGVPATELIDIFDPADPSLIGTVRQQQAFHDKWKQSLIGLG